MLVQQLAEAAGIEVEERDFQKRALTEAEIEELIDAAGGVAAVLSPRNAAVKARGWTVESPPDRAAFVAAAAEDNKMIRRPILVIGAGVAIGNDEAAIRTCMSAGRQRHPPG